TSLKRLVTIDSDFRSLYVYLSEGTRLAAPLRLVAAPSCTSNQRGAPCLLHPMCLSSFRALVERRRSQLASGRWLNKLFPEIGSRSSCAMTVRPCHSPAHCNPHSRRSETCACLSFARRIQDRQPPATVPPTSRAANTSRSPMTTAVLLPIGSR